MKHTITALMISALCLVGCEEMHADTLNPTTAQQTLAAGSFSSSGAAASAALASTHAPTVFDQPTRFDGRLLTTSLVQTIAEGPIMSWEECTDAFGDGIDDCVILTEQDTGETMTTRILSADVCPRGRVCHGGYTVLAETSFTFEDAAPVGSRGGVELVVSGGMRMLHVRSFNFGGRTLYTKQLVDVLSFDGYMQISRGNQDVHIEAYDLNGDELDSVSWMMMASSSGSSTTDCESLGDGAADVVQALGSMLTGVVQIGQVVAGGTIGGVGGFLLTSATGPGAVVAGAAGLAAGVGVATALHAPTEKLITGGADIAATATSGLTTVLCEEFSDAAETTETEFEPGDDTDRDRDVLELESNCDLGYYWGESCEERTYVRSWTTSESYTNEDGELVVMPVEHTEIVTTTDCEWMCLPI